MVHRQRGRGERAGSGRSSLKTSRSELPPLLARTLDGCLEKPRSSLLELRATAPASTVCGRSGSRTGVCSGSVDEECRCMPACRVCGFRVQGLW